MAQYQITVDQELLHRLFLGNNKDAGVSALLESVLNQILLLVVSLKWTLKGVRTKTWTYKSGGSPCIPTRNE